MHLGRCLRALRRRCDGRAARRRRRGALAGHASTRRAGAEELDNRSTRVRCASAASCCFTGSARAPAAHCAAPLAERAALGSERDASSRRRPRPARRARPGATHAGRRASLRFRSPSNASTPGPVHSTTSPRASWSLAPTDTVGERTRRERHGRARVPRRTRSRPGRGRRGCSTPASPHIPSAPSSHAANDRAGQPLGLEQEHRTDEPSVEQHGIDDARGRCPRPRSRGARQTAGAPTSSIDTAPAGEHARRCAGERRLDVERERVVRARGDRDDRHRRPSERDGAVRAVAPEDDDRRAARPRPWHERPRSCRARRDVAAATSSSTRCPELDRRPRPA